MDTNIIELNGKRYDALTGKVVAHPKPIGSQANRSGTGSTTSGRVIDDVIRQPHRPRNITPQPTNTAPKPKPPKTSQPPTTSGYRSHAISAHRPQSAKTLMRSVVKKPGPSLKKLVRVQMPAGSKLQAASPLSAGAVARDNQHWKRAREVSKSGAVHHFTQVTSAPIVVRQHAPLPVKSPPPAPRVARQSSQVAHLTEAGLSRANAHQQLAPAKKNWHVRLARRLHLKPRTLTIVIIGLVVLLTAGLLTYENKAAIDVHIAAARSGVAASLPGYTPSGFSFVGPVVYSAGQVTLSYRSTSDQRRFSILEHTSNWDSQTLYNNLVSTGHQTYQTLQIAGRTVYVDGQGNAAWVNSGLLYQIGDNASLSNQQLLSIVTSL